MDSILTQLNNKQSGLDNRCFGRGKSMLARAAMLVVIALAEEITLGT